MNGDELRNARMGLNLFQGNLAGQLAALGLELPGGQKIDQPAVSQMERGRIEIPAEVAAAITSGKVVRGNDAPPPVGQPGGRKRKKVTPKVAEAPAADPPPDTPAEPSPQPQPPAAEQPPQRPADAPPALPAPRPAQRFDEAARSQLESDLRKLFAGDTFLVPVEVKYLAEDGVTPVTRIDHHEGQIPGIAQVVGMVDKYDGRVIEVHAEAMAKAWADLAAENAAVRKFLMGMTYGGAWRGVIAATMPVVLAIAQHHGAGLPAFLGGPQQTPTDAPAVA